MSPGRPPESLPAANDPAALEETARMLRCLGHPLRLAVLDLLEREGELRVFEIHEALGLEQATCSQHLGLMHDKGILSRRKEGVNVFYSIGDRRALRVLSCVRGGMAKPLVPPEERRDV